VAYEYLDISGDVGLRVSGESVEEVFIDAALGMYSLITGLDRVEEKKAIETVVESDSPEGLLVAWLNELVFRFDTYGFIGKKVQIGELSGERIVASIRGEDFDPDRHERKLLVKAATYHNLRLEKTDGRWQAEIIFDI
jgi:SHS2 domain-containing protein